MFGFTWYGHFLTIACFFCTIVGIYGILQYCACPPSYDVSLPPSYPELHPVCCCYLQMSCCCLQMKPATDDSPWVLYTPSAWLCALSSITTADRRGASELPSWLSLAHPIISGAFSFPLSGQLSTFDFSCVTNVLLTTYNTHLNIQTSQPRHQWYYCIGHYQKHWHIPTLENLIIF